LKFKKVPYNKLNNKQKENHNFHKLGELLSLYGFNCIWLNDDVHGADLLAVSINGDVFKVQLKSRITFDKKYLKKGLFIACPINDGFLIYPHDEALKPLLTQYNKTTSWKDRGGYSTTTFYPHMDKYFVDVNSKEVIF